MKNRMLKRSGILHVLFGLICLSSAVFAQTKGSPQTVDFDISKWLAEAIVKINQANFRLIADYGYKMRRTVTNDKGKTSSTLVESYFPSRLEKRGGTGAVLITLEENGKALSDKKIEKQRREAGAQLEKAASGSDETSTTLEGQREKGVPLDWTFNVAISLSSFLQACRFSSPLQEVVGEREAISLSFDQCDASKLSPNKSYLANVAGKVLFDVQDKAAIRLEAWRKPSLASNDTSRAPKVVIVFAQKKSADGVWLPDLIRVEGIGNEVVFPNLEINWQLEFFDYKLFQTEIKDVTIDSK